MSIFHLRLASAPDDFLLLSPLNPQASDSGMKGYLCNAQKSSWYFCSTCGVRCFTIRGDTENAEVGLASEVLRNLGLEAKEEGDTQVKVWRPAKEGWQEKRGGTSYFSLNATTLNEGQEGLDLRAFHENGWIGYVDSLDRTAADSMKPHRGGMY
jgi:hypothetical protein